MAEVQLHQSLLSFQQVADVLEEPITPDLILHEIGSSWRLRLAVLLSSLSWGLGAGSLMTSAFFSIDSHQTNSSMITVVDEFNLRNDRSYLADWSTSAFMVGNMLGGSILSHLADRYGRKPIFILCNLFQALVAAAAAFSPNIVAFTFLRIFQGASYVGSTLIGWVLGYEHSSIKFRPFTTLFFGLSWVIGYCIVAPIAYYSPSWRYLILSGSVPLFIYTIIAFLLIPETFHFLVSQGKSGEIEKLLSSLNLPFSLNIDVQLLEKQKKEESNSDSSNVTFLHEIWQHKKFLVYCFVQLYLWTCDNFIYFGLSLHSTQLAGNIYLNYILMGLVELPAYIVVPYCLDKFGRKNVVAGSHLIAASCFLILLILPENHWFGLICWFVGKFAISCSFMSLFVYASEVFPTNIRNVSIGLCSVLSRIGGIMAPYIRLLATISPTLPTIVFLTISFLAGLLTFLLPETNKKPLPSSLRKDPC